MHTAANKEGKDVCDVHWHHINAFEAILSNYPGILVSRYGVGSSERRENLHEMMQEFKKTDDKFKKRY